MIYKSRFLDITLVAITFYSVYFLLIHKFSGGKIPFWDFHITYCAAKTFFLGNFPYGLFAHGDCLNPNITLTANYSPIALEMLKYLGSLNIKIANFFWVLFEIISFSIIFYVLKKIFKFNYEWRNFFIIFFSFGASLFTSFFSGNISVILYGFISLGIYFLFKKKFDYYYLIILFVSLFKFYYLAFLILPFYIIGWKSINKIFLCICGFIFIQYLSYINNPEITLAFFDVIQGKYENIYPTRFQTGTGLFSIIEKMPWIFIGINDFNESFFILKINLMIWFFIISLILISVYFCLNSTKNRKSNNNFLYSLSFGILAINLVIPRLVVYDVILTVPIIFYLLNQINFKKFKFNKLNIKYLLIFSFLILFDHHFIFFVSITFLSFFIYSEFYKKRIFNY
tara:strand:+ start:7462 stop:8652 length:1191 start_codon:yes stop_codon:yes gene_type:complete